MVRRNGRDECWHCGATDHDTAGHPRSAAAAHAPQPREIRRDAPIVPWGGACHSYPIRLPEWCGVDLWLCYAELRADLHGEHPHHRRSGSLLEEALWWGILAIALRRTNEEISG